MSHASDWSGRRVLVTGAGGFIGSHLTELLVAEGAGVRALVHYNSRSDWANLDRLDPAVRSELEVVSGDIQDPFGVRRAVEGTEVVFHLAALIGIPYSYVAPQAYVATNVLGTVNVLEAVRSEGTGRMIHTSTSENYGEIRHSPIDEAHPLQGRSPYSASKIGADQMAESYFRAFETPVSILRPFNTFGPRQSLRAVIPTIAAQALSGPTVTLGSLSPIRDLTFVEDTARAFLAVASSDTAGMTLNAGNGKGISIGDLAELVIEVAGSEAEVVAGEAERVRPEASEVPELVCDSSRLRELTGWAPEVTLREGVERTVEWVRDNLSDLRADVYNV
jgi:NAD dependent epimerase/dehydratase